ncbi:unnamed protein product [Sphagnum balticum]
MGVLERRCTAAIERAELEVQMKRVEAEEAKYLGKLREAELRNGPAEAKDRTDAGVYALALKSVTLAESLRQAGYHVILGIDDYRGILQAEWHLLQLLQNSPDQRRLGEPIRASTPKVAPLSPINELYSKCDPGGRGKGSLTGVVASEGDTGKDQPTQVTPFSNTLKHLSSLTHTITLPAGLRANPRRRASPEGEGRLGEILR